MLTEQLILILVLAILSVLFTSFDKFFKAKKTGTPHQERLRHYLFSPYSVATIMQEKHKTSGLVSPKSILKKNPEKKPSNKRVRWVDYERMRQDKLARLEKQRSLDLQSQA